jgi:hypothetical protein
MTMSACRSVPASGRSRICLSVVAASLVLLTAKPSIAQSVSGAPSAEDARWQPWLGCWTLQNENVREGEAIDPTDIPAPGLRGPARRSDIRVCVEAEGSGVTLNTLVASRAALRQTIVADGKEHPIDETGCQGRQRAEWSRSGDRLFTHAELACNAAAPRTVSHLAMMVRGGTWLDIQSVTISGRESVRIRRYQRASDVPTRPEDRASGGARAARPLTLADIREASAKLSPRVVEMALVESDAGFDLDGKTLIGLDEAGVPDSVIDLMVALSYPDRFIVDRPTSGGGYAGWGSIADWSFGDPFLWGYYAPFAYTYWGYGNPWDQPGYGWVIVDPGGSDRPQPSGTGRVVDGQGYTRVRPREVTAASGDGSGRNGGSSSGTSSTGSSGGSSSGGSSGGGVTGQGYSGGAGSDSGRTAQPRPPGR